MLSENQPKKKRNVKENASVVQVLLSLRKISDMDFQRYYSDLSDVISSFRAPRCLVEAETNHGVRTTNTALLEAVNKSFAYKSRAVRMAKKAFEVVQFSKKKKKNHHEESFHISNSRLLSKGF